MYSFAKRGLRMGLMVNGRWYGGDNYQIGADGVEQRSELIKGFIRMTPTGAKGEVPAEAGRYHLVECPGCPSSHRISVLHRLKGLEGAISTSLLRPVMSEHGREFGTEEQAQTDPVTGFRYLYEMYFATVPNYSGRDSMPILWDKKEKRIVSNCYTDIFDILNAEFDEFATSAINLRPKHLLDQITEMRDYLAPRITGAVYECGFSRDQKTYNKFAGNLETTFPELEKRLSDQPYLLGDDITEVDIALFTSLVRYDAIYIQLFQCPMIRIEDSPVLTAYLQRIQNLPGVSGTFDLRKAMTHYYVSHAHINPSKIVPPAPALSWLAA
jgi:putative glutathione S-transferase